MIHTPLSTTSVLDEAADLVSKTAAPWAGLVMITALPYRFLQALFLDHLFEVGSSAAQYGNLLGATANVTVASIVLALWGRAVYARGCRLALARGESPGREALRIRPAAFACYVLTSSVALLLGAISIFTVIGFVAVVIFAGLALGTMELNERVSVFRPFGYIFRYSTRVGIPLAITFIFFCAIFVVFVNLAAAFQLGQWLAAAVGAFDAPHWHYFLSAANRRFVLILIAGSLVLLEPFWIAANVIFVRKAGAQESGDDLRTWLDELRRAA